MSKSTDVLLVDGPSHGDLHCAQLPVRLAFTVYDTAEGDHIYFHRKHLHKATQLWFHLAVAIDDYPYTDSYLDEVIDAANHQPAWDLNPMRPQVISEP